LSDGVWEPEDTSPAGEKGHCPQRRQLLPSKCEVDDVPVLAGAVWRNEGPLAETMTKWRGVVPAAAATAAADDHEDDDGDNGNYGAYRDGKNANKIGN
jgi:Zn-finger nucleic acid-binding protein